MKKNYVSPEIEEMEIENLVLLANSDKEADTGTEDIVDCSTEEEA